MSYQSAFFIVPARILDLPGITLAFLRFYETIFQFWHHKKPCYLSNDMLKERTKISSSSTIKDAFTFFEKHNELKRIYKGKKRYLVQPELSINDLVDNLENDCTKNVKHLGTARVGSRQGERQGLGTARHKNKNINMKNVNKNLCASDDAHMKKFNEFYFAYPKKRNKQAAMKAWKKIDSNLLAFILSDIKNRLENDYQWKNKQFIPNPSTYLNGKMWNDEIINESKEEKKIDKTCRENPVTKLNGLLGVTKQKNSTTNYESTIELDQSDFCQI